MVDLQALSQAYQRADRAVASAERALRERTRRARDARDAAREALALGIVAAWREDGVAQAEIARRTGYSREQVRRILRAHGIEAGE